MFVSVKWVMLFKSNIHQTKHLRNKREHKHRKILKTSLYFRKPSFRGLHLPKHYKIAHDFYTT